MNQKRRSTFAVTRSLAAILSSFLPAAGIVISVATVTGITAAPTRAQTTYGPGTGGSIPDNNATGITSVITVAASPNQVTSVNSVTITGLVHPWAGDLTATLSHGNVSVSLFARPGGASDNTNFNGTYTFTSTASQTIAAAVGALGDVNLPGGNYLPAGSLSSFAGLNVGGAWSLNINDQGASDVGSFTSWGFNATSVAPIVETYNTNVGGSIPDNSSSGVTSDIVVSDVFQINTFNSVTIRGLQHSLVGDLTARIQNVNTGTIVDLFNRPGRTTNGEFDFGDDSNLNGDYTFRLNGNDFIDAAAQGNTSYNIPTGIYAPSTSQVPGQANPNTLASFSGQNLNGTWRLLLSDSAAGDIGSFTGWGFSATPFIAAVPEPGTGALVSVVLLVGFAGVQQRRRSKKRSSSILF